tara:strand:+ start:173 stop:880 length:708 start_codon:yes stop_codon:yes gene_type:complete
VDNKVWFFGDSFTNGHGCRPGFEYYERYPNLREKIWTDLISEKLNLEQVNLGISGNSNTYILKQLIENLKNFKSGDYIFLTNTLPIRIVYPTKETKTIKPFTTDIILWPKFNKERAHLNEFITTKEEEKIVIEYIHQSVVGKETAWNNFYNEQFFSIQNFLLNTGVEVYTWSHQLWFGKSKKLQNVIINKYETIDKATKGKVDDGHWSWKGHRDFYNEFIKRIEKKEYKFEKELF